MRSFVRFNLGVLGMPLHWQLWVVMLVGANIVAPFFFLDHVEARITLAAGLLGLGLMTALTGRFGFSRIVGLGHAAWIPLLAFLVSSLGEIPSSTGLGLWLRFVIVLDAISLVLDAADVVRFVRGDRDEVVAGLDPPLESAASHT